MPGIASTWKAMPWANRVSPKMPMRSGGISITGSFLGVKLNGEGRVFFETGDELFGPAALFPESGDGEGVVSLGQSLTLLIED